MPVEEMPFDPSPSSSGAGPLPRVPHGDPHPSPRDPPAVPPGAPRNGGIRPPLCGGVPRTRERGKPRSPPPFPPCGTQGGGGSEGDSSSSSHGPRTASRALVRGRHFSRRRGGRATPPGAQEGGRGSRKGPPRIQENGGRKMETDRKEKRRRGGGQEEAMRREANRDLPGLCFDRSLGKASAKGFRKRCCQELMPSLGLERVLGGPQDVVGDTSDGTTFGTGPSGCASCLQFSPDGSKLATATADCRVQIFDTTSGQRAKYLEGHSEIVTSLAWFHQAQHTGSNAFFTASLDKTVRLWMNYEPKVVLRDHCDWIRCLGLSADDSTIVSGCVSSNMVAWDVETGQLKFKVSAFKAASCPSTQSAKCSTFQHSVNSLQFSNSSANVFASGIRDGSVLLWDTRSLASGPVLGMKAHFGKLNQIQLGRSDNLLLSGGRDGAVRLWDMRMLGRLGSSTNQAVPPHENPALQMEYKSHSCSRYNISSVLLNYDRYVATGSEDRRVWIYDTLTGQPVKKLEGHSAVTHFVHTPSEDESGGPLLASSSIDSSVVHLWSPAASMEQVRPCKKLATSWMCCDSPVSSQTSMNGLELEEGSPLTPELEGDSIGGQQEEQPGPMLRGVEEFAAQRVRQDCLQRKAVEELMQKHGDVILRIFHHFDYSFRSPFDWQALLAHVRAAQQLHETPGGSAGLSAEHTFANSLSEIANDFQQVLQQFVDRQGPLAVHPVR